MTKSHFTYIRKGYIRRVNIIYSLFYSYQKIFTFMCVEGRCRIIIYNFVENNIKRGPVLFCKPHLNGSKMSDANFYVDKWKCLLTVLN